jgi:hypothetical protein
MRKAIDPKVKFLSYVEIKGEDECWPWHGRFTTYGAGLFTVEHTIDGKRTVDTYFANRFSYEYFSGDKIVTRYLDNVCPNRWCCNPAHMRPRDFDARFWDNTDRSSGCWVWLGSIDVSTGYGSVTIDHKALSTHRVAYETYYKEKIPKYLMVLHSCNNRKCINPAHLRLGTHDDNMQDMVDCGHSRKGESNGNNVHTEEQVRMIKYRMKDPDCSLKKLSTEVNVPYATLKDIKSGRLWGWLKVDGVST